YRFNGQPIWPCAPPPLLPETSRACPLCHAPRVFEIQLMPPLLFFLLEALRERQEGGGEGGARGCGGRREVGYGEVAQWEWMTVAGFTCLQACGTTDLVGAPERDGNNLPWLIAEEAIVLVNDHPLAAPCCCQPFSLRCLAPARHACCAAMASLRVLAFDHEGRPIQFDTWLDDLQLYLLSDSRDSVSLFDHTSGASPAPPATTDSANGSQWLTRDATARLAIRNHLPLAECAHFGQHRTAHALYDAVVARYSSPATAALGRLLLPYLFPELSTFATVEDLVLLVALRACPSLRDVPPPPLPPPTPLLLLLTSLVLRTSRLLLLVGSAAAARARVARVVAVVAGVVVGAAVEVVEALEVVAVVGVVAGVGALEAVVEAAVGVAVVEEVGVVALGLELLSVEVLAVAKGSSSSVGARPRRPSSFTCGKPHTQHRCFSHLDDAWRAEFGDEAERPCWAELLGFGVAIFDLDYDAILAAMNALSVSAEGDCYLCVPPDPGIEAAALGASESALPGTAPAEALHTFTLDSGASRSFFRDSTTLTLLSAPVRGPVLARSSTVLPCPSVPSGSLSVPSCPALPPCVEGLQRTAPHSSSFPPTTAPLQTLHMDMWGPARVSGQGRERYIMLVVDDYTRYTTIFPLRSKGQVPDVLIPWIRATRLQLRKRFRQDLPVLRLHSDRGETSPTLHWTGEVGDASMFWVSGSRAFFRDTSADKLSARAISCVFLGFSPNAPGWQFYHPTSRHVLPSQDVTFDESVPFYRLFPYHSAPLPPPPLFLAPGPPPIDPLPPPAVGSGAASGGAEPGGADSEGARSEGAEPGGAEPGGAESEGVEPGGAESEGVESGGAEPRVSAAGDTGVGGVGVPVGAGGTGGGAVAGPGGARTRGTGVAGTSSVVGTGAGGAGAGDPAEPGGTGAGGARAGGARAGDTRSVGDGARGTSADGAGAGGAGAGDTWTVDLGDGGAGAGGAMSGSTGAGGTSQPPLQPASPVPAPSPYTEQTRGLTERHELESCPALPIRAVRTGHRVPRPRPPPVPGTHAMALRPSSVPLRVAMPPPPESSLPAVPNRDSDLVRAASPTVSRLLATVVTDPSFESTAVSALVAKLVDFAAAFCLDCGTAIVAESESASPPSVGGECALGTDVLEDRQEDLECLAAAVPRFASMLLAPEGDPDAPNIPTPRSYTEAITGPYSSQWQAAMDAKMACRKSTGTYVDEVPPRGANIVDGMWIFRGVDYFQNFSPTPKMTTLRVLLHVTAQRDYELHSLDFSTAFLQGSLHEEIWLRRPPGFTESFPAGTQWSLRRPVYGLRQAPHEWHDTLRTKLAALGFTPSTADPSVFLRTDTSMLPFYILVYVDDLVFATDDTEALTVVLQCFGFQFSLPQPTPLSTSCSLSAPPSDESVEPSGLYPELVGCLMYLMTCTRPDLACPLSLLARYVAPGRHQKVHWDAAKRALRYLCSTSGMGLMLGGRDPVVVVGHVDPSWVDDLATQRSSPGYTVRTTGPRPPSTSPMPDVLHK
ncbi:unnamed protein product, partial [Closterium sp. NIES-53]